MRITSIVYCCFIFFCAACTNSNNPAHLTNNNEAGITYPYVDTFITTLPTDTAAVPTPITLYVKHISKDSQVVIGSEPADLRKNAYKIISVEEPAVWKGR